MTTAPLSLDDVQLRLGRCALSIVDSGWRGEPTASFTSNPHYLALARRHKATVEELLAACRRVLLRREELRRRRAARGAL